MKKLLFFILFIPILTLSQSKNDSILIKQNQLELKELNKNFIELQKKYEYQIKVNDQTLNSISNQIGATSYNLSIFAFLFGLLAIGLGVYVTWVERKIIKIREENESLLKQTISTKNEVVAINKLIQKDIYGLFVKIKREETTNILNRLCKVPSDIPNVINELFSRELFKEDFITLKKAFLALENDKNIESRVLERYKSSYFLLFFQHFLDLTIKDEVLDTEMTKRYYQAIKSANSDDIIKSTEDFTKSIIDLGFQSKELQINEFLRCISISQFKNFDKIYQIIYESLKTRDDKFKLYQLLEKTKSLRVPKMNLGNLLISEFGETELTTSEKEIIEDIDSIKKEILQEEERKKKEEKERRKKEERKKKEEKEIKNQDKK